VEWLWKETHAGRFGAVFSRNWGVGAVSGVVGSDGDGDEVAVAVREWMGG